MEGSPCLPVTPLQLWKPICGDNLLGISTEGDTTEKQQLQLPRKNMEGGPYFFPQDTTQTRKKGGHTFKTQQRRKREGTLVHP